jgi:hypothetical protein
MFGLIMPYAFIMLCSYLHSSGDLAWLVAWVAPTCRFQCWHADDQDSKNPLQQQHDDDDDNVTLVAT